MDRSPGPVDPTLPTYLGVLTRKRFPAQQIILVDDIMTFFTFGQSGKKPKGRRHVPSTLCIHKVSVEEDAQKLARGIIQEFISKSATETPNDLSPLITATTDRLLDKCAAEFPCHNRTRDIIMWYCQNVVGRAE
jgi:hypothetical protein